MTAELYAFTCGHLTLPLAFLLEGAAGEITVPVPSYLIVHPRGKVLFDTGLNPRTRSDPARYLGDLVAAAHRFDLAPGQEITSQLAAVDVDADDIDIVINSHLHFDHAGGNAQLSNADIVVQRRELSAALADNAWGYAQADLATGQRIVAICGEHDLFGDGSVVCIPTYGHTRGHQSVRVRTESREYVLCADACQLDESLKDLHLPGIVDDKREAMHSLLKFACLQSHGMRLIFGHDPKFWATVPQGPARLR